MEQNFTFGMLVKVIRKRFLLLVAVAIISAIGAAIRVTVNIRARSYSFPKIYKRKRAYCMFVLLSETAVAPIKQSLGFV
jgi:hypothetical protein